MATEFYRQHYDARTVHLHRLTAILVTILWLIGRFNSLLPKGPLRLDIWSIHVLLGFALLAVVVTRIWWRASRGATLPPAETGWRHGVAQATHAALYFLLVGVVGLGVLNVLAHGFPLFGVWSFPKIGGEGFSKIVNGWHDLLANILATTALFHAAAALFHGFALRDGVLGRMWPGTARD
ncbi:MAG: Cytochrome [Bradyrhizobium sp.]|nr:Cytochrome [Bradyrhizobium sp.]